MAETTVLTIADTSWHYLYGMIVAARVSAGQVPLSESTAARIIYTADKDNVDRIFRIGDPLSGGEGQPLLAEEIWEDGGAGRELHASLRSWFIKGSVGDKLEVTTWN